jgi:hypothetical protein
MLLIITPTKFLSAVYPLQKHKEQTGILTKIVTLEYVNTNYTQKDPAERVKRCIADLYQKEGHRFVLLVGDSDIFPVRYTKTDRANPDACNTAFYPTDLYYAALYKQDGSFDDWDANHNGYYGELNGETHTGPINVDEVSLEPVVAVGRVPASTPAEVKCYVDKVISYEQNSNHADWARNALLMATDDPFPEACQVMERVAHDDLPGYSCTILSSTGSPCTSAGSLTPEAITQNINSGIGLVGFIGHGSWDSLDLTRGVFWGIRDIPQLTNTTMLPIMFASACNTAAFSIIPPYDGYTDVNGINHNGTNNREKFPSTPPQPSCTQPLLDPDDDLATNLTVRTNAGVVAYLGGVTGMQYYEPLEYFFHAVPTRNTVGEAWQYMVKHYYEVFGMPGSLSRPDWEAVARVHQPWKITLCGDPSIRIGGAIKGAWSRKQLTYGDHITSHGPALAVHKDTLFMAWKGKGTNPEIFFSSFDGTSWSPQQLTSVDYGTSCGPALCAYKDTVFLAWKGPDTDTRIYFSAFDRRSPRQPIPADCYTSHGPALAVYKDKMFMAWKGKDTGSQIFFSLFDGKYWSPQQLTSAGYGTSHGPALAVYKDKLFMAWKGKDADPQIFFSSFDGTSWSPQQPTSADHGTSHSPALAVYRNKLFMAWKGKDTDPQIFFSSFDGNNWSPSQLTSDDRKTSDGPALAMYNDKLFLVWKEEEAYTGIFFSYLYCDS